MAVIVVFVPNVSDAALPTQVPELEDGRGKGNRPSCEAERQIATFIEKVEWDALFCPTVGPILSGVRPGVSLYSVFIFSNKVCGWL